MRLKDKSVRRHFPLATAWLYILRIVRDRSEFPSGLSGPVHRGTLLTYCSHYPEVFKPELILHRVTVYNVFFFVTGIYVPTHKLVKDSLVLIYGN